MPVIPNFFLCAEPTMLEFMHGWSHPFWGALLLGLLLLVWRKLVSSVSFHQKKLDVTGKAVLVTGCDTGFGHSLALRLFHLGFTVFATCLFPDGEGAQRLRQEAGGSCRMHVFKLDVTQDQDVVDAKDFLLKNLPEKALWGLVNNAGLALCGKMEWISFDDLKKVIDVNVLGSIRTTLKLLPLIKKSQGRLIFMSSINAFIGLGTGSYALSKMALERCGDILRVELKKFGVKVSLIEPGNYSPATNILKVQSVEKYWNTFDEETKASYSKEYLQLFFNRLN
ncbi:short-chain dehydrogenase/reductase family 9C member 7-like [Sarcophilus harrisii]